MLIRIWIGFGLGLDWMGVSLERIEADFDF